LIPAGTGFSHHAERRKQRKEARDAARGLPTVTADEVEKALSEALNSEALNPSD